MQWGGFFALTFLAYVVVNTLFALVYHSLGPNTLQGADAPTALDHFLNAFFFSAHTLTTVGYGSISPKSTAGNIVAAIEAMVGLMGFALATGLLFGRVSRPSAKIGYSSSMLIAPYQDGTSLQFRVVNQRANTLMELEAKVMLMTVVGPPGQLRRDYKPLQLHLHTLYFF